ncbi:uracil-DNA glycosylase [Halieaceae bacterium IMCC14734]|uniref:Uracil-DNA glycosylase n=1 Tax=Candidatus Litorirhabdus singularis TaxID=2518993 RepID=A0ABT3TKA2_9GAMM|nr:uracil-DNA glycosylase [Candidatus Litorirhabdus singularis]MCX2981854.1 uracil-DNA glycosylase [Candidatus Litorirhabdus singularis]
MKKVSLEASWLRALQTEFDSDYMIQLGDFLRAEKQAGKTIYPASAQIFSALDQTPLDSVKVVILGQDPYHGPGQAHGLCFSVLPGVRVPPSLVNIYKELETELGVTMPAQGCLTGWTQQGVLLLNSVLTVEHGQAASHQGKGWERFTDRVISIVNEQRESVVFMLWGAYAQRKGAIIDRDRHCVLEAPHPSPLSAYRGFFGCGHFVEANQYLQQQGLDPIDWSLPAAAAG